MSLLGLALQVIVFHWGEIKAAWPDSSQSHYITVRSRKLSMNACMLHSAPFSSIWNQRIFPWAVVTVTMVKSSHFNQHDPDSPPKRGNAHALQNRDNSLLGLPSQVYCVKLNRNWAVHCLSVPTNLNARWAQKFLIPGILSVLRMFSQYL